MYCDLLRMCQDGVLGVWQAVGPEAPRGSAFFRGGQAFDGF